MYPFCPKDATTRRVIFFHVHGEFRLLFAGASAKCFRAHCARKSRDSRRQNERTLLVLCASVSVNGVNSNVKDGNLYIPGDSVLSGMDYYGKVFMKDNVRRE